MTGDKNLLQLDGLLRHLLALFYPSVTLMNVFRCDRQLRSHAVTELKYFPEAKTWEMSVDYFGLTEDSAGNQGLILINLANKSLGLTELGELHAYCRAVRPMFAVQVAEIGLSRDLYNLLLRPEVSDRLLSEKVDKILIYAGLPLSSPFLVDALFPPLALG